MNGNMNTVHGAKQKQIVLYPNHSFLANSTMQQLLTPAPPSSSRMNTHLQEPHNQYYHTQRNAQLNRFYSPISSCIAEQGIDREGTRPDTPESSEEEPSPLQRWLLNSEVESTDDQYNPIDHWRKTLNWPEEFAEKGFGMVKAAAKLIENAKSANPWIGSNEDSSLLSYTECVKRGIVPKQYTAAYETWIKEKGLDMNFFNGRRGISEESKGLCLGLQDITRNTTIPNVFANDTNMLVMESCQNANEGKVNRDVTPLIVPPVLFLGLYGEETLKHIIDEVRANWNTTYVLAGPVPQPDLAVGLLPSAFSEMEMEKVRNYMSVDNWAIFTDNMCFPFLMCQVKCDESLDKADRQNMHSCSVAVRAILRLEQEADRYREAKQLDNLQGQVLVFSISHNQQDARVYGHFAKVQGLRWEYYRYEIEKFSLRRDEKLAAIQNLVRNIFKAFLPKHLERIKNALSVLPEPNTLSIATSDTTSQECFQDVSVSQGAGSFQIPELSVSEMKAIHTCRKESKEQTDKILQTVEMAMEKVEKQRQESRKYLEQENEWWLSHMAS